VRQGQARVAELEPVLVLVLAWALELAVQLAPVPVQAPGRVLARVSAVGLALARDLVLERVPVTAQAGVAVVLIPVTVVLVVPAEVKRVVEWVPVRVRERERER
jgi:hypothetical protein